VWGCASRKNIVAVFGKTFENTGYLRRRFSLAEYDLRHSDSQSSMMIHFGEAQVLEGKVAQALNGIIRRNLSGSYLLQKFADGFRIQVTNQRQQNRSVSTIMLEGEERH
jgi:hypothetical protein